VLVNLLTFFALTVSLPPALYWIRYSAVIALIAAVAQVLVEGPRWQMIPAYILAGLFFLIWLLQIPPSGDRSTGQIYSSRLIYSLLIVIGVLGLLASIVLPIVLPVFRFPNPTGPYKIGTLTYHWVDNDRPEIFTADPGDNRELMVQIWYPAEANPSSPRAPWVENAGGLTPVLARLLNLPEFIFGHLKYITSNSVQAAPIADNEATYPVLLFMHGFNGFRQHDTFQVEELVSHGYIVAAIDQPFAAAAVVFPDGREVIGLTMEELDAFIRQSINPATTAPEMNGQVFEKGIIPYLAKDAIFTLDQLALINQADPNGILTGKLDLERAGIFGVSLGGIVDSEACLMDSRLKACLIMDAPIPADVLQAGLQQPTMVITRDAETMRLERERAGGWSEDDIEEHQRTMRALFESVPDGGYLIKVPGIFHLDFLDTPLMTPLASQLGLSGTLDGQRVRSIINTYTLVFFDRQLKGLPGELLDGPSEQFPEVIIETRQQ